MTNAWLEINQSVDLFSEATPGPNAINFTSVYFR